jgi:isoleucyl-tRNA synthetase
MYKQLPEKLSYSELEKDVLEFWEKNDVFGKSLELRKDAEYFSFFEGPPTVNGKPGIHHMMARTIKDAICRYKSMRGYFVRRQAGWDTHGLPVEIAVEKQLGLADKADIEKYGMDKFNKTCKEFVYHNIEMDLGWRTLTKRMGYWVDMNTAYITCTNNYVESVWWALKSYFDKGLIYKGFKVVPQSPTIETPLSSHELSLGYKDVRDPNCYLKLKVADSNIPEIRDAQFLVWTTTPWTLFANVALAVGVDIDYVVVINKRSTKDGDLVDKLVLAESRLSALDGEYEIVHKLKGKDLLGSKYHQIFQYDAITIDFEKYPDALSVLAGDFVSTEDGSGIVHIAPAFGEDDYSLSRKNKIPFLQPVTPNGHFVNGMDKYSGKAIKNFTYVDHEEEGQDKHIIIDLKIADKIYRCTNDYLHSYPHCWRTGNPIMYYARESWFIKSPEYKEKMVDLNKTIYWQPAEIGAGRFGNWLEDVKEWSLSRDRFWGSPIPIWVAEDGSDMFAIGSIAELKEGLYIMDDGSRKPLKEVDVEIDLHRPFVDKVVFEKNGKTYKRIHEIVDVWFDSGSMPFAQLHYPFENKELFEKTFPGDFIAEGIDQTRGWFYTLHNIATALFDKPAFKNIIVNELILDEKGIKMSKSKGNVIDPFEIMEKHGADAVRWYLFVNNPPWKATLFSEKDLVKTVISDFLRSLTNTYAFFSLYANIDGFTGDEALVPVAERPEIDRWIISSVNSLTGNFISLMEKYEVTKAFRAIQEFVIGELSNWYIRRNRRRFWKGEKDKEKIAAYQTLKEVMINVLQLMAPLAPFISEDLYLRLRTEKDPISIHLTDFPTPNEEYISKELERRMELAQKIVNLARSLREKAKIRVRQPLRRILIPVSSPQERRDIQHFEAIILEELNVKGIEFVSGDTDIVSKSAKGNFKVIGKKFGKSTQAVANAIKELSSTQIKELEQKQILKIIAADQEFDLIPEDVEIVSEDIEGWLVASEHPLTVAIDTTLDAELISEGAAREFINRIQNLRKNSGFEVTDRISIKYSASEEFKNSVEKQCEYIKNETLAASLTFDSSIEGVELDIEDDAVRAVISKL